MVLINLSWVAAKRIKDNKSCCGKRKKKNSLNRLIFKPASWCCKNRLIMPGSFWTAGRFRQRKIRFGMNRQNKCWPAFTGRDRPTSIPLSELPVMRRHGFLCPMRWPKNTRPPVLKTGSGCWKDAWWRWSEKSGNLRVENAAKRIIFQKRNLSDTLEPKRQSESNTRSIYLYV